MTRFLFIHDFYRDGYTDMLAEVRVLQECGQWTRQKRKSVARDAVSSYKALKHNFPRMDVSYFAGRVAAIKSHRTAHVSCTRLLPLRNAARDRVVYRPLPSTDEHFCELFDCWNLALWGLALPCSTKPLVVLCDVCRQEWQRMETAYITPDGWDWDDDEDDVCVHVNSLLQKL